MSHLFTTLPVIGSRPLMLSTVTFVVPFPLVSCNIKPSYIGSARLDLNPGSIEIFYQFSSEAKLISDNLSPSSTGQSSIYFHLMVSCQSLL